MRSQRGDLSQNPKLEPGDSVVVPLADAVYVNGEVKTGLRFVDNLAA